MQMCKLLMKHNENPYPVSIMAAMITFEGVNTWLFELFVLEKTPDGFLLPPKT